MRSRSFAARRCRIRGLLLAATVAVAVSGPPLVARAAPASEERAAAATLFDEGRRLMSEGRYDLACPKLADSLRLVPGVGTRFNLAECYEHSGKLATAWLLYREVAAEMARERDAERESTARDRIRAIEPRLCKLEIDVQPRVTGLTITRNGRAVDEPLLGAAFPVDAGTHTIEAAAPGHQSQRVEARVEREGETVRVRLALLTRVPSSSTHEPSTEGDEGADTTLGTAGWATLGSGLAVAALGGVLLGVGYSKIGKADEDCSGHQSCSLEAADLGNEGRRTALAGVVATALGGAATITGVIVLAVSATSGESAAADAGAAAQRRAERPHDRARLSIGLAPAAAQLRLAW